MHPAPPVMPAEPAQPDPFRYGWRYVKRQLPDGSIDFDQVPLTLEDVLHPQEEDVIPQRHAHSADCRYLTAVFESRPLAPPISYVSMDLLIDWGVAGLRAHSPDVAVFVGLRQPHDPQRGTLRLAELGGRCLLVVEVVSPDTRNNDAVIKVEHYHRARIPLYALIDQEKEDGPRRLVAYRWRPAGYEAAALDEQGRLFLPELGLYLSVQGDRAVCHDAATGRELGDYVGLVRELEEADRRIEEQGEALEEAIERARHADEARQQAEQARLEAEAQSSDAARRANREARRADDAARRADDEARRAEDAARRAEDEARRADDEARRAEDEARRADDAARRANAAEKRLAELLAQLGQQADPAGP